MMWWIWSFDRILEQLENNKDNASVLFKEQNWVKKDDPMEIRGCSRVQSEWWAKGGNEEGKFPGNWSVYCES